MDNKELKQKAKKWFNNTVEKGLTTSEHGIVTTYCPDAITGYIAGAEEVIKQIDEAKGIIRELIYADGRFADKYPKLIIKAEAFLKE